MGVKSKVAAMAASTAQLPPKKLGGDAWRIPLRLGFTGAIACGIAGAGYYYWVTDFTANTKSYHRVRDPFVHDIFEKACDWPDNHDDVIRILAQDGRKYKVINLVGSRAANDQVLSHIAHYCPDLEAFHAAHIMGRITDQGLVVLALGCPKLRILDLANVGGGITDAGLTIAVTELKNLEALRVEHIGDWGITNGSLRAAVMHNPNLQHLNFHGELTDVTDEGLLSLAEYGKKLVTLDLGCAITKYTNHGIKRVLEKCEALQLLDVQCIGAVNDDIIYDIAAGLGKHLKVLKAKTNFTGGKVTQQAVDDLRLIRPSVAVYTDDKFTTSEADAPTAK